MPWLRTCARATYHCCTYSKHAYTEIRGAYETSLFEIPILRSSILTPLWTFSAQFAIDIDNACTGGAQPLIARARAPVCPSLATPLMAIIAHRNSVLAPTQYARVTRLSPAFRVRVWLRETKAMYG